MQIKNHEKLTKKQIFAYVNALQAQGVKFATVKLGYLGLFPMHVVINTHKLVIADEQLAFYQEYTRPYDTVAAYENECRYYNEHVRNLWYYLPSGEYARTMADYAAWKKAAKNA